MSKITPKNLSYDTTLPPFLARLQSQNASSSDGRHEYTVARPKKTRTAAEEEEDEPVYFDEGSGETLTKTEWESREATKADEKQVGEGEDGGKQEGGEGKAGEKLDGGEGEGKEGKVKIAEIGGSKKRKVGRVVGDEDGREEDGALEGRKPTQLAKKTESEKKGQTKGKVEKKKGKKIKLSFGDDE